MATTAELQYLVRVKSDELRRLEREVRSVNRALGRDVPGATGRASSGFSKLGAVARTAGRYVAIGVGAGTVAAGVGLVKAVQAAGDFETSLNTLQAVSGATGDQMKRVSALAKDLGADITLPGASAQDAADAMTELAKGGLSVQESMDAAKGVLQLATAAQIDNAEAATIAARALNAFGLQGDEAVKVADLLAATANASTAEISDLALGMQAASAVFEQGNQDIDDLTTALGLMANAGIVGSDAGTSLKTMMLSLLAPTGKAADEIESMGIQLRNQKGEMVPLREIIAQFTDATKGMSDAQRDAAFKTIFGSDAIRAANVILGKGTDKWDKMNEATTKGGDAAKLAAAKTKGFNGALQAFQSALETLAISVGTVILPAITPLINKFSDLVGFINRVVEAPNLKVAVRILFTGVKGAVGDLRDSLRKLILGSAGELKPLKLDSGKIIEFERVGQSAGLVSSLQTALDRVDWTKVGEGIGDAISSGIKITADFLDNAFTTMADFIESHSTQIAELGAVIITKIFLTLTDPAFWAKHWDLALAVALSVFTRGIGRIIGRFGGRFAVAFGAEIIKVGEKLGTPVGRLIARLGEWIALSLPAAITRGFAWLRTGITGLLEKAFIISAILAFVHGVEDLLTELVDWVKSNWKKAIILAATGPFIIVAAIIASQWKKIRDFIVDRAKDILGWLKSHWKTIVNIISGPIGIVARYIADKWNDIKRFLQAVWGWIRGRALSIWGAIRDNIVSAVRDSVGKVKDAFSGLRDALGSIWGAIKGKASSIWSSITGTIGNFVNRIIGGANKVLGFLHLPTINVSFGSGGIATAFKRGAGPSEFAQGGVIAKKAKGDIVRPVPGGVYVVAEAGYPEAVMTLDPKHRKRTAKIMGSVAQHLNLRPDDVGFAAGGIAVPRFGIGGFVKSVGSKLKDTVINTIWNQIPGIGAIKTALELMGKLGISFPGLPNIPGDAGRLALGVAGKAKDEIVDWAKDTLTGALKAIKAGGFGAVIAKANEIDAKGFSYVWGGGHSPATYNGPYDCSGAVSAILRAGHLMSGSKVSGQFMSFGLPGKGPVTIEANSGHVYSILNGRAWGTSSENPGGGAGWIDAYTFRSGFVTRHVEHAAKGGIFKRGRRRKDLEKAEESIPEDRRHSRRRDSDIMPDASLRKFISGGKVRGTGRGDTVPAFLSPGEAVLTRDGQRMVDEAGGPGFLDRVLWSQAPHFQEGGRVNDNTRQYNIFGTHERLPFDPLDYFYKILRISRAGRRNYIKRPFPEDGVIVRLLHGARHGLGDIPHNLRGAWGAIAKDDLRGNRLNRTNRVFEDEAYVQLGLGGRQYVVPTDNVFLRNGKLPLGQRRQVHKALDITGGGKKGDRRDEGGYSLDGVLRSISRGLGWGTVKKLKEDYEQGKKAKNPGRFVSDLGRSRPRMTTALITTLLGFLRPNRVADLKLNRDEQDAVESGGKRFREGLGKDYGDVLTGDSRKKRHLAALTVLGALDKRLNQKDDEKGGKKKKKKGQGKDKDKKEPEQIEDAADAAFSLLKTLRLVVKTFRSGSVETLLPLFVNGWTRGTFGPAMNSLVRSSGRAKAAEQTAFALGVLGHTPRIENKDDRKSFNKGIGEQGKSLVPWNFVSRIRDKKAKRAMGLYMLGQYSGRLGRDRGWMDFAAALFQLPRHTTLGANFTMPFMAQGGIVRKPTVVMAGEAGPEAIVPLRRSGGSVGGITVNVNYNAPVYGDRQSIAKAVAGDVRREMLKTKRRNINAGLS